MNLIKEDQIQTKGTPQSRKTENVYIYDVDYLQTEVEKFIRVRDVIGSEFCIASDDGQKVYNIVAASLSRGRKIRLSFKNITIISYVFLNSAIGQLYDGRFSEDRIKEKLNITDISPDHNFLLGRIILRAKEYYKNPGWFESNLDDDYAD